MTNHQFSIAFALSLGGLSLPAQQLKAETTEQNMNVVFLLIDDIRWNSIGYMGNDFVITPNIDKLAEEGVLFENCYVTTSISCVSRATILTGQYMSRHNVEGFSTSLTEEQVQNSYPEVLRQGGYWAGIVGKHGVGSPQKATKDYDFNAITQGSHWISVKTKVEENGVEQIKKDSIHVTQHNINGAMKFLDEAPKDRPFVLSVGFFAPHAQDKHPDQYRPQLSSMGYYQNVEIPTPVSADDKYLALLPEFLQESQNFGRDRWFKRFTTPESYQTTMKNYFRLITEVDLAVGEIVDRLKAEGLYENTLIIVAGDNGYFHSEHQLADKWYPYNEALRVPLIIRDPRIKSRDRGERLDQMVLNIDIAPTILGATGHQIPSVMQGEDLSTIYIDGKKSLRKEFFYEHPIINDLESIPDS
ncbi:MAG: sulfatase-like hydrolase/transferase, partial [Rikenellaceae bacterium]